MSTLFSSSWINPQGSYCISLIWYGDSDRNKSEGSKLFSTSNTLLLVGGHMRGMQNFPGQRLNWRQSYNQSYSSNKFLSELKFLLDLTTSLSFPYNLCCFFWIVLLINMKTQNISKKRLLWWWWWQWLTI